MPTRSVNTQLDLEVLDCASCGVYFAMPERLIAERRRNGGSFYCPNGHSLSFTETDLMRAQKRAKALEAQVVSAQDQAQAAREERDAARRSTAATKGQLTRERKRAAAGVCPCCNRTFKQLSRHMEGQHPQYVAEQRSA